MMLRPPILKLLGKLIALLLFFTVSTFIVLMVLFLFYAAEVAGASTPVAKSPQSVALAAVCIVI